MFEERRILADKRIIGYRGSDNRDMAFGFECDVGALEGLGPENTEHATVEFAEVTRATDTTIISSAICCAKSMFLSIPGWCLIR